MKLVGAAGAIALGMVLAGPVPAAEVAACSGSSGVTVVVDYGALGGIQVGCAGGDPATGLGALNAAGFGTTGTRKDGPGFVCRINGVPAADPCVVTPPATAYWSYWHAPRGGSWAYSSVGAAGYNPAAGSVEGWSFGSGGRPGLAPPAAPTPPPVPPPAPKPTTKPVPKPAPKPTAAPPRTTTPGAQPTTGTGTATGTSASRSASPGASTSPSGAATPTAAGPGATSEGATNPGGTTAPPTADPGPVAGAEPVSSSTPVGPFAIGAVLVAGLGTAGFLMARRRRTPG
jgi:hypothetical protein